MVTRLDMVPDPLEECGDMMEHSFVGKYVEFADYQSLQAALREALQNWYEWNELHQADGEDRATERNRITELRKQFLED